MMRGVQADLSSAGHSHTDLPSFQPFGNLNTEQEIDSTMEWLVNDLNENEDYDMLSTSLGQSSIENDAAPAVRVRKQRNTLLKDDDWECKRDVITRLYASMTLEKVMHEMSESYDFHASKQMYLRRIKKWGIMKNFKASEKEAVASRVSDGSRSVPLSQGRSIPVHRIVRHIKAQEKSATHHPRNESIHSPAHVSGRHDSAVVTRSPRITITWNQLQNYLASQSVTNGTLISRPPEQKLETFLWRIRDFTEVLFQQKQQMPPGSKEFWVEHNRITHLFDEFGMCIVKSVASTNGDERFQHINKACSLVQHLLEQPYWLMMLALLRSFRHLWIWQPIFAIAITKHVRDMARELSHVPSNRYVTQILDLFLQLNNKETSLFDLSARVVLDTLDQLCETHIESIAGPTMKNALSYPTNRYIGQRNSNRDSDTFEPGLSDQGPIRRLYAIECIWLQIIKLKERVKQRRHTRCKTLIVFPNNPNDRVQYIRQGEVEEIPEPP